MLRRTSFTLIVMTVAVALIAVGCGRETPSVPDSPTMLGSTTQTPGTRPDATATSTNLSIASIEPMVTATGQVSVSVDAAGTNGPSAVVQVETPGPMAGTVQAAYFAAASTGFTFHQIADGDITIDGAGVSWDTELANSIDSYNYWTDVTSMVEGKINAAAPGSRVDFTITETNTFDIDGVILAVIFDDPNQTTDNTVILLFGAQDIAGDNFLVNLADPIDIADPELVLDMCLGISYGYQTPLTTNQVSWVDVNGSRLTSSAGGQDDGEGANGGLITAGGLDDANNNPPPNAPPADFNDPDDELYNLIPFVSDGDTQIDVFTTNPSNDDNILFACFFLTVEASIGTQFVDLDIKPRSCPNPLNVKIFENPPNNNMKGGVLPVAILGTADFDVQDIDVSTLLLEGVAPIRHNYDDVTTPLENGEECECISAGVDGFMDLTLKFKKAEVAAALGDVYNGQVVPLTITGFLLDGTPLQGTDCVVILSKELMPTTQ